ncbi:MAG TPA: T9SS type A sorting domain-containing protein, partial [Bacteroidia bacterium]|nr:T9SS type A sorting domain-containing protein [Bacteroidia bacterium]
IITTFAGTGVAGFGGNGGQAALAMLNTPQQVTADTAGNIFVTDAGNSVIRKITPSGIISSFAGNRTPGYSGDGGPAFLAEVFHAPGVSSDKHNNIYISDYSNSRVRKVSYCATPLTLSISGTFSVCTGDSTQLTASGATTYTWSSGATANTVYVKPIITSSYSVAGVTGQCAAVDSVTVNVVSCSSNITGFERDKMIIYPNPASDLVSIHSSLNTSMLVEIYNSTGEKLLSNPVKNSETRVNLNNLNAGMYFMRIIFGDGTIHQATIIKQ